MASINEILDDLAVKNQIFLMRFGGAASRRVVKLLKDAETDLTLQLSKRLERLGPIAQQEVGQGRVTSERLAALLSEIREQQKELTQVIGGQIQRDLIDVSFAAVDIADRELTAALGGVDLGNLRPPPELLRAAVTSQPVRGRPLRVLLKDFERSRFGIIQSEIRLGIVEAQTQSQIIKRVRDKFPSFHRRAEAIVRTSVNHVSNRAREHYWRENQDIIQGLRWTATLDNRVSRICAARNGQIFQIDKGPRPPAHPNCFLGDVSVLSRSPVRVVSKRWFEGEVITIRTSGNLEITGTPNHPILTNKGWLPLKNVANPGVKIVCDGGRQWPAVGDGDGQNAPASIKNVVETFLEKLNAGSRVVGLSSKDFHSDAADGDIAIIGANSGLLAADQSFFLQLFDQFNLFWHDVSASSFSCFGRFASLFEGLLGNELACDGRALGQGIMGDFAGFQSGAVLRRSHDVGGLQNSGDWPDADTILASKICSGGTGNIFFDDIVFVEVRDFRGHVYNLETDDNFYIANGIIVHNCRSTMVPVTKSWDDLSESGSLSPGRGSTSFRKVFEQKLKAQGFTPDQIRTISANTRASMNGQVPADQSFGGWLRKQSSGTQNEILGVEGAKLWRDGKLEVRQFVDRHTGRSFTIEELRKKAGVD